MGPIMTLPNMVVSHQELRTSVIVRRVFDFITTELQDIYK